jgi:hypothetical protein
VNFRQKAQKTLRLVNHIKMKKNFKTKALPKATEPWMGDHDHPFIISQQGVSSTVDATLNLRQTCPSHYSKSPLSLTMTFSLHHLNLQDFLNVCQLSLVVHCSFH